MATLSERILLNHARVEALEAARGAAMVPSNVLAPGELPAKDKDKDKDKDLAVEAVEVVPRALVVTSADELGRLSVEEVEALDPKMVDVLLKRQERRGG